MKNLDNLKWAVVSFTSRDTQDDRMDKINIAGLFSNPIVAEDSFIPHLPNQDVKRYLVHVDDLERFEEFYNFVQDINEKFGDYAIFHINDGDFLVDELNKYRQLLGIWTDTKIA